jgi:excinuclease ABC subunit C
MVFLPSRPPQVWLLDYANPLTKRFGTDFFKKIPQRPGIYWMMSQENALLYIGKAKNLKKRICSYQHVKPERSSRKILRMVQLVTQIYWEECETENAALLRENELLRTYKPPFNVLNTRPENYYFIAVEFFENRFCFKLTTTLISTTEEKYFGTFKGKGSIRRGFCSMVRLLWVSLSKDAETMSRFEYPRQLSRKEGIYLFNIHLCDYFIVEEKPNWIQNIKDFLNGDTDNLLLALTEKILLNINIPPFYYHWVQEDLEILKIFYRYGPYKNRLLRTFHQIQRTVLRQEEIDDLLVTFQKKISPN